MKQTMKRLLGFCLVIMMMLTFIPTNVFAVADLQIVGDAKLFLPSFFLLLYFLLCDH